MRPKPVIIYNVCCGNQHTQKINIKLEIDLFLSVYHRAVVASEVVYHHQCNYEVNEQCNCKVSRKLLLYRYDLLLILLHVTHYLPTNMLLSTNELRPVFTLMSWKVKSIHSPQMLQTQVTAHSEMLLRKTMEHAESWPRLNLVLNDANQTNKDWYGCCGNIKTLPIL